MQQIAQTFYGLPLQAGGGLSFRPEDFSAGKNRPDHPLTDAGRGQAERLGARLASTGLQAVYSSDLVRAVQTAESVAKHAGLPVFTDLPYPGGETGAEAAARAMKAIGEIAGAGLDRVAVVTHGGIIRVIFCAILGIGQEKRFLFGPPGNTSVNRVRFDGKTNRYTIDGFNDVHHLLDWER